MKLSILFETVDTCSWGKELEVIFYFYFFNMMKILTSQIFSSVVIQEVAK
jgi:hypothetical protein